eukprot:TRINITY_DN58899_c0_g1_i1.p1 TRINITY_DN58899_c0_g1~~TRINITY_DN58899_c0_g1_i1.p1  ORF type:complete len:1235 (+),score=244.08 TRINITY_DN58899_c0_g1_i1:74-3778(+)
MNGLLAATSGGPSAKAKVSTSRGDLAGEQGESKDRRLNSVFGSIPKKAPRPILEPAQPWEPDSPLCDWHSPGEQTQGAQGAAAAAVPAGSSQEAAKEDNALTNVPSCDSQDSPRDSQVSAHLDHFKPPRSRPKFYGARDDIVEDEASSQRPRSGWFSSPLDFGRMSTANTRLTTATTYSRFQRLTRMHLLSIPSAHQQVHLDSLQRRGRNRCSGLQKCAQMLADSVQFTILTTLLTVVALFGDDFRLAATHKDMDPLFDGITIICILVFGTEVVVMSLGRAGYFKSFFFYLDAISTVTMLIDVTVISEYVLCGGGDSGVQRTGKAGRAGARVGRTVRVVRLLRVMKLYKAFKHHLQERRRQQGKDKTGPGEEARQDSEDELEMRVGNTLADLTTRRVIVMVLVMLLVVPFFQAGGAAPPTFQHSAQYSMNLVYQSWMRWCPSNSSTALTCLQPSEALSQDGSSFSLQERASRRIYEDYLLSFIYGHHTGDFHWKLIWAGLLSEAIAPSQADGATSATKAATDAISRAAPLGQERYLGEKAAPVGDWNALHADPAWLAPLVPLSDSITERLAQPWVERCQQHHGVSLAEGLEAERPTYCSVERHLRCSEYLFDAPTAAGPEDKRHLSMIFAFDKRAQTTLEARLNMALTIALCVVIAGTSVAFNRDAEQYVLTPLAQLIVKLQAVSNNPLDAMTLGDKEYRRSKADKAAAKAAAAARKAMEANQNICRRCLRRVATSMKRRKTQPVETVIIEQTIVKLGGILVWAYGEAGADVVSRNLRGTKYGDGSLEIKAQFPASTVEVIVGSCGLRDFPVLLDTLKTEVTVLVNAICEIIHALADEYNGAPHRNFGSCGEASFLLIWRLSGHPRHLRSKLADMAALSVIRLTHKIATVPTLDAFEHHPALQCTPGLQRQGDGTYRPQLGISLHCGYVSECAIGTEHTLEALYVSPIITVASQLQAAAIAPYNAGNILTHTVVAFLSHEMAMLCRLIDHVCMSPAKTPLRLFTMDLDVSKATRRLDALSGCGKPQSAVEEYKSIKTRQLPSATDRFTVRQIRDDEKTAKFAEEYTVWDEFCSAQELLNLRESFDPDFFLRFSTAYRNYEAGQWQVARDLLVTCHPKNTFVKLPAPPDMTEDTWPDDGPTRALLSFMKRTNNVPPEAWKGHRRLDRNNSLSDSVGPTSGAEVGGVTGVAASGASLQTDDAIPFEPPEDGQIQKSTSYAPGEMYPSERRERAIVG